jgi:hypothetical protein
VSVDSALLGTFAAVNGVVSVLSIVFGHRRVIEWLTAGWLGQRNSRW